MSALFPTIPPDLRYRQSQAFTPYTVPTGLKYFEVDFERSPQITFDGSNVTTFTGPYNTNPPFTQATLANKPLWQPLAFNFRPCATWDGADTLRNTTAVATLGWPTGGAFEIWALVEYTGALLSPSGTQVYIFNYPTNAVNTGIFLSVVASTAGGGVLTMRATTRVGTGAASVSITDTTVDMLTGRHIIRVVSDGATVRIDVDGNVGTPVACVAGGWTGGPRHTIGGSSATTATNPFVGNMNFLGMYHPLPTFYAAGLYAALAKRRNAAIDGNFPWGDPLTLADLEFTVGPTGSFYSQSLGLITSTQAITTTRSTAALVFDGNSRLQSFAIDTPCIATGRGLWAQTTGSCRIDFNNTLSNAAWVKTNITATQDLASAFSAGTPLGWRITATAADATIMQDYTTITPSGSITMSTPHAMFYLPLGATLTGAVEITQDGGALWTDIRSSLIAGQWVQIPGIPQTLPLSPVTATFGVRVRGNGDSIGFCLANVERGYTITSPILTPSNATVNRTSDVTILNTANFPSLWDKPSFTVLVVCEPQAIPLPPFGSLTMPRTGWTVLEINNPYNITMTGVGNLVPYVGPGSAYPGPPAGKGSLMTVTSADPGFAAVVGNRMTVGSGVGSYTDIMEQLTSTEGGGALGGAGTYRVYSTIYPDGQTTPASIVLEARVKDAQGYGLNAALKPDDVIRPFAQRIGLTITNELANVSYGFDPQTEDYRYNEPNAEGFAMATGSLFGLVALRGNIEQAGNGPGHYTASPILESDIVINLGSQYPSGGPLDGVIQRIIIIGRTLSADELSQATIALQAHYA